MNNIYTEYFMVYLLCVRAFILAAWVGAEPTAGWGNMPLPLRVDALLSGTRKHNNVGVGCRWALGGGADKARDDFHSFFSARRSFIVCHAPAPPPD